MAAPAQTQDWASLGARPGMVHRDPNPNGGAFGSRHLRTSRGSGGPCPLGRVGVPFLTPSAPASRQS